MFWSLKVIFAFALLFAAVAAAPISATNTTSHSVDSETLLSNAQEAQHLNDQFQDLQLDDSCTDEETACISNAIAQCNDGQWEITQRCAKTQKCFALPSLTSEGTTITCTSERTAKSLFKAVGATGGPTGSNSSSKGGSAGRDQRDPGSGSGTPSSPTTATGAGAATVTVTVTVTAMPTHFVQTTTISPQQASALLASISAAAQTQTPTPTPTPTTKKHHRRPEVYTTASPDHSNTSSSHTTPCKSSSNPPAMPSPSASPDEADNGEKGPDGVDNGEDSEYDDEASSTPSASPSHSAASDEADDSGGDDGDDATDDS